MNHPIRPAGQTAPEPQTNPWKVLALVFGGILVYEAGSYYLRDRRYRNPSARKTFRIVENGVYLGTFAGETYEQARFSASQHYWTNEYATLAEKAQEVEAKRRSRRNPARSKRAKYEVFAGDGYSGQFIEGENHLKTNSLEEAQEFAQRFMRNHPRGRVPLSYDPNSGGRVRIEHKYRDGGFEVVAKWIPAIGGGWVST